MTEQITMVRCPDCKTEFDEAIVRLHLVLEHNAPTVLLKHGDVVAAQRIVKSLADELDRVRAEVLAIHHPRDDGSCVVCFVAHPCATAKATSPP